MNKKTIIIMAAMDVESDFLIQKLKNITYEKINKYEFHKGTINNYPVIICNCHIGTINATLATSIAIQKYNPLAIISQGTAGGHSKNVHRGDIVIGESCINIASCKTTYKSENEGSNPFEWEIQNFDGSETLKYQKANIKLVDICKTIHYTDGNIHIGTIGSGDIWNREIDRILWFHEKYGTLCEDMESIAIYTAANQFDIPVIGIRIISNNEILGETYERNLGKKSQEFTYNFINTFYKKAISSIEL